MSCEEQKHKQPAGLTSLDTSLLRYKSELRRFVDKIMSSSSVCLMQATQLCSAPTASKWKYFKQNSRGQLMADTAMNNHDISVVLLVQVCVTSITPWCPSGYILLHVGQQHLHCPLLGVFLILRSFNYLQPGTVTFVINDPPIIMCFAL